MLIPVTALALHKITVDHQRHAALAAVQISRDTATGQPLAVATDATMLAAFTWCEPPATCFAADGITVDHSPAESFSALVPADDCRRASAHRVSEKIRRRNPSLADVVIGEHTARIDRVEIRAASDSGKLIALNSRQIDAPYPNWRQIVPDRNPENSISVRFNGHKLAELAKLLADHAGDAEHGITLTLDPQDLDRPIVLSANNCTSRGQVAAGVAVLMPLSPDRKQPRPSQEWHPSRLSVSTVNLAAAKAAKARIAPAPEPAPEAPEISAAPAAPADEARPQPQLPQRHPVTQPQAPRPDRKPRAKRDRRQPRPSAGATVPAGRFAVDVAALYV